jgi:RNA polymerase sigma factor (TIGR02999 family)
VADHPQAAIPQRLEGVGRGEPAALDALIGVLYEELRHVAHRRSHGDATPGTVALVHGAYVRLRHQTRIGTESRAHVLALAARALREILRTYVEQRGALKRGGDFEKVSLDQHELPGTGDAAAGEDVVAALDRALQRLDEFHARPCGVVECRFYGGLTVEETAVALGLSPRTVTREWVFAQAWLKRELSGGRSTMNPSRAERLAALFERALELEPHERRKFCEIIGRGDRDLGTELQSLLTAHDAPGDLDALAARVLPDLLDGLSRGLATNGH